MVSVKTTWQKLAFAYAVALAVIGLGAFAGPLLPEVIGPLMAAIVVLSLPVMMLGLIVTALWPPTVEKLTLTCIALAAGYFLIDFGIAGAHRAGEQVAFRLERSRLDQLARLALSSTSRFSADTIPSKCAPSVSEQALRAAGYVMCRAMPDRVVFVRGGLLNREHGYVYLTPAARSARELVVPGTRVTRSNSLGNGWYAYSGH